MGSVLSSGVPKTPKTENEKSDQQISSQSSGGYFSSLWPWPKKRDSLKCDFCEIDLPADKTYSWCDACNKGFHHGTCNSQAGEQARTPHTCPRCSTKLTDINLHPERMKVKTPQAPKAPKYVFPYTDEFPPPKRIRHLFRTPSSTTPDEPLGPPPPRAPQTTFRRPEET